MSTPLEREIAAVFREESGRATAALTRIFGDLDLAEEAVQEAFIVALRRWPVDGMPRVPGAWITTTARRKAIDRLRREQTFARKAHLLALDSVSAPDEEGDIDIPDDRLALLFTCCHPALPAEGQIALTLRAVGGLTTREIARAFVVPEATMAQRLTRAKAKIRRAGVPFRVPPPELLESRLQQVLRVLYLIFNEGYTGSVGTELLRDDLSREAIRLAEVLVALLPDEPEARGLLALMLLHDSRRGARVTTTGDLVPLDDQDRSLWDHDEIERGRAEIDRAITGDRVGQYQLQAAIALVHASAIMAADTDWVHIAWLYGRLSEVQPTPVVELNRAVALAMAEGPERGLLVIDRLCDDGRLDRYHLLHSARADLLRRAGRRVESAEEYRIAIGLTENERERAFLLRRLVEVTTSGS